MPTVRSPRKGSLQFYPRKRASRPYTRIRHYPHVGEAKLNGFAGYKVGMTHLFIAGNRSGSQGKPTMFPATIIECPPLKIASVRFYTQTTSGLRLSKEVMVSKDRVLARRLKLPKKEADFTEAEKNLANFADVRVNVYTQPSLAGVGKKTPEFFEMGIGGNTAEEKLDYAKSVIGKGISVKDILSEGQQADVFGVTKGKGIQGPVKRFGIGLKSHKSEKGRRAPANLGSWAGNRSWTVSHAGRMGFHNRSDKNKWILRISSDNKSINAAGGFVRYGAVKSDYVLLKGSVPGATKRLVRIVAAQRPHRNIPLQVPPIEAVSLRSRQK